MSTPLVVVGAGGFGRETLDVVDAVNAAARSATFHVLGVIDASPSAVNVERLAARGVKWLGRDIEALDSQGVAFLIGIGNPVVRQKLAFELSAAGLEPATAVHPGATIGSRSSIGAGSIVCGGVQISTNVVLGSHVHVNPNATIGHDSRLEDFVSINPGAIISGDVVVHTRTLVGAGATVLQGLELGEDVVVGASACVVRNVTAELTVKGVPAR